jgi:hypothetical protein
MIIFMQAYRYLRSRTQYWTPGSRLYRVSVHVVGPTYKKSNPLLLLQHFVIDTHGVVEEEKETNGGVGELNIGTEGCGEVDGVVVIHPNCETGWAGTYCLNAVLP